MGLEFKYGSHIPVLINLLEISDGDVLEMGMGYFSTPLLHWFCRMQNRQLFSYENDPRYYSIFSGNVFDFHKMTLVDDWDRTEIDKKWSIVLIDHAPPARRADDIRRLANVAEYIVIHDTSKSQDKHYHYSEIWSLFKHRVDIKLSCQLSVVSNFVDVAKLSLI